MYSCHQAAITSPLDHGSWICFPQRLLPYQEDWPSQLSYTTKHHHKIIPRHTIHTIVSWPNLGWFKSDHLAAFSFRAQRCARNEKAARGSDLNRTRPNPKQWLMIHISDFMIIRWNKTILIFIKGEVVKLKTPSPLCTTSKFYLLHLHAYQFRCFSQPHFYTDARVGSLVQQQWIPHKTSETHTKNNFWLQITANITKL